MIMDCDGWTWIKELEIKGYGRARWSWIFMDGQGRLWKEAMNDIAWHERAYIFMERLRIA